MYILCEDAPVAQLDRASDYESAGRGFESLRAHFKTINKRKLSEQILNINFIIILLFYKFDRLDMQNQYQALFQIF